MRLDEDIIKKIDILVKQGKYKNRTDALRDQITK
ncbi:MAG: ribbon-helix-helix domain-containing protein [Promethearchaeota archaeon]